MKRTKSRAVKLSPSDRNKNNIGTQTENFDSLIEVAKLEEQVRLLQLENNILRQHAETSKPDDKPTRLSHLASQTTPKINGEKSGCGCKKGNCSSRICGCVKKNNKCNPSCKCDDKICQNQKKSEYDHENKENVNGTDMETPKKRQSTKRNGATEKTRNNRGLFTPDMSKVYTDLEEGQYGDINFSFNDKNDPMTKNSQTASHNTNNVELKKKRKVKKEQDKKEQDKKEQDKKEQQQSTEKVIYDPMKPRHQLSRTPPNSKKLEKPEKLGKPEKSEKLEIGETIQTQLHCTTTREETVISPKIQDIKEERIDWDEHTAQLIPCKICKRTFMPERIQKHEACCKNI